jgi:CheY-like chemotaxis protein
MRNGRSLLLIDDDETTRELLSLFLRREGWTVVSAKSGDEALRMLDTAVISPDVILSDLQMPGLSGATMARSLRGSLQRRPLPPLLMAMTATETDGIPEGFDDLLIKPFTPSYLLERCQAVWSGHLPVKQAPSDENATPSIARATFDRMKTSMPGVQLQALYDFALNDAEVRVHRMASAMEKGDDVLYRKEAHALKGSCGMVGALRLRNMAAEAEEVGLQTSVTDSAPLLHFYAEIEQIRHMLDTLLTKAS